MNRDDNSQKPYNNRPRMSLLNSYSSQGNDYRYPSRGRGRGFDQRYSNQRGRGGGFSNNRVPFDTLDRDRQDFAPSRFNQQQSTRISNRDGAFHQSYK